MAQRKSTKHEYNLVVTFQISQIGDDDEADEFLRELQTDPAIKDLIFVTAGKYNFQP